MTYISISAEQTTGSKKNLLARGNDKKNYEKRAEMFDRENDD